MQPFFVEGVVADSGAWYNKEKRKQEANTMREYELVHEIKNLCRNNQMRDVFFEEIECDDPESYVRTKYRGNMQDLTLEAGPDGQVTIHAVIDGLIQKFVFTPI